ncbi:MAG: CYTH domain-containing protein [Micavibrio sp.]|nr:CYTH domain-containing protein [Micavibrio sp.]
MLIKKRIEVEQELKIKLTRQDLEKVFTAFTRKPRMRNAVEHKYMPRAYYDTPDLLLYRHSISLRVQYKPGKAGKMGSYEQTLKYDLPFTPLTTGVLFRKELKDPLPSHMPNLRRFIGAEAQAMVKSFKNKKFVHVFTAGIERRSFDMKIGSGKKRGTVEVAFDVGAVILPVSGKHYPFAEIEIEVKNGNPVAIEAVQKKILRLARSAKIQPLSKAQQGSLLFKKTPGYKAPSKK